jgi:hypothetical protein
MHGFAMQHEAGEDLETNEFYQEGLGIIEEEWKQHLVQAAVAEVHIVETEQQREAMREVELLEARLFWEKLKAELSYHLDV